MTDTRWWKYVQSVAGDTQAKDIADRVGIDKSNLTRWKQGSRPAVEFVLQFARKYNRPVVESLAAAEYITDAEANIREVKVGASDLGNAELIAELARRLDSAEKRSAPPAPKNELPFMPISEFMRLRRAENVPSPEHTETPAHKRAARKRSRDRGEDTDLP